MSRRRALAQNFLVDERHIALVLETLHPPPGSTVIDLGAGAGALTAAAAGRGARVVAVELDPQWVQRLRSRAPSWGDVEVVRGDIRTVRFPPEPYYVVSNAPFNLGTQVVRRLLTDAHGMVRAAVVLQREAAGRLAGCPRTGRFAATWAPWFELDVVATIPARSFRPAPSVDAALLSLTPRPVPLLSPAAYPRYDAFLERVFSGRAATVGERLGARGRSRARAAGVDPSAIPSAVPAEAYAALFSSRA